MVFRLLLLVLPLFHSLLCFSFVFCSLSSFYLHSRFLIHCLALRLLLSSTFPVYHFFRLICFHFLFPFHLSILVSLVSCFSFFVFRFVLVSHRHSFLRFVFSLLFAFFHSFVS